MRPVVDPTTAAALAAALCLGCATAPPRPPAYAREVAMPADLAAAIAASALRQALPHSDPLGDVAAPPADRLGDGRFAIAYERTAAGGWLPVARHRLRIVMPASDDAPLAVAIESLRDERRLPSLGAGAAARFEVSIADAGDGATVRACDLPGELAAHLAAALDGAFTATGDDAATPLGLAEPNLRTFVGHRRLLAARRALADGAPQRAAAHLRRAARVLEGSPAVECTLGVLVARTGDHQLARAQLLRTGLVATDPATRAWFTARSQMHDGARSEGFAADRPARAMSLHTARRSAPDPVRDYTDLGRLHAQANDDMGELACVLLAREHAAGGLAIANTGLPPSGIDRILRSHLGIDALIVESAAVAGPPAVPSR